MLVDELLEGAADTSTTRPVGCRQHRLAGREERPGHRRAVPLRQGPIAVGRLGRVPVVPGVGEHIEDAAGHAGMLDLARGEQQPAAGAAGPRCGGDHLPRYERDHRRPDCRRARHRIPGRHPRRAAVRAAGTPDGGRFRGFDETKSRPQRS